jgi:hypothetical protein
MRDQMLEMGTHPIVGMSVRPHLPPTFGAPLYTALIQAKRIRETDTNPLPLYFHLTICMVGILHAPNMAML